MQKCWAEKPEDRPEFNEMRGEITVMLNLDDESYGYLSVESQGGPKYTQLTMQDSKVREISEKYSPIVNLTFIYFPSLQITLQETAPCSTPGGSQDMDEDGDYDSGSEGHSQGTCAQLDQVLTERFGEEQKKEIKQIFCEITSKSMRGKRRQSNSTVSTYQS